MREYSTLLLFSECRHVVHGFGSDAISRSFCYETIVAHDAHEPRLLWVALHYHQAYVHRAILLPDILSDPPSLSDMAHSLRYLSSLDFEHPQVPPQLVTPVNGRPEYLPLCPIPQHIQ